MRLANAEENEKNVDFWAKKLGFINMEVFLLFIFGFFYNCLWVYTKYLSKKVDWIGHENSGMIK